jgi:hypothetical protein
MDQAKTVVDIFEHVVEGVHIDEHDQQSGTNHESDTIVLLVRSEIANATSPRKGHGCSTAVSRRVK